LEQSAAQWQKDGEASNAKCEKLEEANKAIRIKNDEYMKQNHSLQDDSNKAATQLADALRESKRLMDEKDQQLEGLQADNQKSDQKLVEAAQAIADVSQKIIQRAKLNILLDREAIEGKRSREKAGAAGPC